MICNEAALTIKHGRGLLSKNREEKYAVFCFNANDRSVTV
jgi:hypothetical protein